MHYITDRQAGRQISSCTDSDSSHVEATDRQEVKTRGILNLDERVDKRWVYIDSERERENIGTET